jgi:serine/threonine protein phosphatase PrpC
MPAGTTEQIRLFLEQDMPGGEIHSVPGGVAVVYSVRCPGKASVNEDAALLLPCDADRCVLAVADGFGGQPAGDQASRLATGALVDSVEQALLKGAELREGILNGFERANQAVSNLGVGAASTLAAVELENGSVRTYHVGDSEILLVGQRGRIKLQTISHSPVGYAVEAGWLEEAEALHHQDRHLVSNMLGTAEMRIEIGPALQLRPRDTLLLATDGLFDNLHLDEIVQAVRKGPLTRAVQVLADRCTERMQTRGEGRPCKPDDLTFVVFRPRA